MHQEFTQQLLTFFMTFLTLLHSSSSRVTKQLPQPWVEIDQNVLDLAPDATQKEEFRSLSPTPAFTDANLLLFVIKRLRDFEDMVHKLQAKPSQMLYKKELLCPAVYQVDAFEVELIAIKKLSRLHKSLIRQEEPLAYTDSKEETKFGVWPINFFVLHQHIAAKL